MDGASTAIARLAALALWPSRPTIEPIAGGRTNENFRVDAGGRTYFARVGIDLPHHGISRKAELRCIELAAQAGIAPAVLHAADGILITEFFAGRTLAQGEPVDDAVLVRLAEALRRLAARPVPADLPPFDPVEVCRGYIAALPAGTVPAARLARTNAIIAASPGLSDRSLIHADLIPENVMVAADRISIVDWEYAGRGDPAVDVAAVVMNFGLDARQSGLFVDAFGAVDMAVVRRLEPLMALREALWCDTQRHFVGVRGDLEAYSTLCWQRIDGLPA
ncbi:MAG: phosphotransferase family protein [Proteobacteria bacterium]|nr:phosphotransferase family protein [Pseudomonadota bacterium]